MSRLSYAQFTLGSSQLSNNKLPNQNSGHKDAQISGLWSGKNLMRGEFVRWPLPETGYTQNIKKTLSKILLSSYIAKTYSNSSVIIVLFPNESIRSNALFSQPVFTTVENIHNGSSFFTCGILTLIFNSRTAIAGAIIGLLLVFFISSSWFLLRPYDVAATFCSFVHAISTELHVWRHFSLLVERVFLFMRVIKFLVTIDLPHSQKWLPHF